MHSRIRKLRDDIKNNPEIVNKDQLILAFDACLNDELFSLRNVIRLINVVAEYIDTQDYSGSQGAKYFETKTLPTLFTIYKSLLDIAIDFKVQELKKLPDYHLATLCIDMAIDNFTLLPEFKPTLAHRVDEYIEQYRHFYRLQLISGEKDLNKLPGTIQDWLRMHCHEATFAAIFTMKKALAVRLVADRMLRNLPVGLPAPVTDDNIIDVQERKSVQFDAQTARTTLMEDLLRRNFFKHPWKCWHKQENPHSVTRLRTQGHATNPILLARDSQKRYWLVHISGRLLAKFSLNPLLMAHDTEYLPYYELHPFYADATVGLAGGQLDIVIINPEKTFNQKEFIRKLPPGVYVQSLQLIPLDSHTEILVEYDVNKDKLSITSDQHEIVYVSFFANIRRKSMYFQPIDIADYYSSARAWPLMQDDKRELTYLPEHDKPERIIYPPELVKKINADYRMFLMQNVLRSQQKFHFDYLLQLKDPALGFNFSSRTGDLPFFMLIRMWFEQNFYCDPYKHNYSNTEMLAFLEKHQLEFTRTDSWGRSAFHVFFTTPNIAMPENEYKAVIDFLKRKGVKITSTDILGRTVIHYLALTARPGDVTIANIEIAFKGTHLDFCNFVYAKDKYGWTALQYAKKYNPQFVEILERFQILSRVRSWLHDEVTAAKVGRAKEQEEDANNPMARRVTLS